MRTILTALQEGRLFELPDNDKSRALEFLARILDANPEIEVGTDVIESVKQREHACNTGIGAGVAVPHVRAQRDAGELFCAIGWSRQGIDYGAPDGRPVHLVFMYYIPGMQKNLYLKEVSILAKAIKRSAGMESIESSVDLSVVRNLLLDWVISGMEGTQPEAVARMVRLELKQAHTPPPAPATPATGSPAVPALPQGPPVGTASRFFALLVPPTGVLILSTDAGWSLPLEKESGLAERLADGAPFTAGGRQVYVLGSTAFAGGRTLFECVALAQPGTSPRHS